MIDTAHKLDSEAKDLVCQGLARRKTYNEIVDILKSDLGIEVTQDAVGYYARSEDWQPRIDAMRADWDARLADVPYVSKRERIEELAGLYAKASKGKDLRVLVLILGEIRKELEGDGGTGASSAEIRVFLGNVGQDSGLHGNPQSPPAQDGDAPALEEGPQSTQTT